MANPFKFLQEVRAEASKVTWPTRRETMITTVMVFIMVAVSSVFFLAADQVIDRVAWAADGRDDERARADRRRHVRTYVGDLAEVLVANDEEVVARRCQTIFGLDDVVVGAAEAHAQHPHEDASAVRHVVDARPADVAGVERVGDTGSHGYRPHRGRIGRHRRPPG